MTNVHMWTPPRTAKALTVLARALLAAVPDEAGWVGAIAYPAGSCVRSPFVARKHGRDRANPRPTCGRLTTNLRQTAARQTALDL